MKLEVIDKVKSGAPGRRGVVEPGLRGSGAPRCGATGAQRRRGAGNLWSKWILLALVLLIALPAQALAIGITPGSRVVEREPGKTFEYRGLVVNNEHKRMTVGLGVEGELKEFVNVEPKVLEFTKDEKQKEYLCQVMVPFSAETGSMAYIIATEQVNTASGGISAVLSVKGRIIVGEKPKKATTEELVKVDTGTVLEKEAEAETRTTGLVVGKESKAGLFKNKVVGIILLTAGLLIMGGLLLMGVSYKKQASKAAVQKWKKKKKEQQAKVQERLLELEDYVSKCRANGISKGQIKNDLVKKEWDEKVVDKLLKRIR